MSFDKTLRNMPHTHLPQEDQENPDDEENFFEFDTEEDEEVDEPSAAYIARKVFRIIIAGVVLVSLVYISGVYQSFLYSRTSQTATQVSVEEVLHAPLFVLPLRIFALTGAEDLRSMRDDEDIERLVVNASEIWKQASIELTIESISRIEIDDGGVRLFLLNPAVFMREVEGYNPNGINVFLVKSLGGINGIAFSGSRSIAVADFTTVYDFRVLAHEMGHILGLSHIVNKRDRLMFRGANGFGLLLDEIITARTHAENFIAL